MVPKRKLGELLIDRELITEEQLLHALSFQNENGGRIGSVLVTLGYLKEEFLLNFLSLYFDIPQVDLRGLRIEKAALRLVKEEVIREFNVLPIKQIRNTEGKEILMLAMTDPTNYNAIASIEETTGLKVEPFIASFKNFQDTLKRHFDDDSIELGINLFEYDPDNIARKLTEILIKKEIISAEELKSLLDE